MQTINKGTCEDAPTLKTLETGQCKKEREQARAILREMSSYHPHTTYRIRDTDLFVHTPGGLRAGQVYLVRAHRTLLFDYLTTPPDAGESYCRRGHIVEWTCSEYGVWVCKCYYAPVVVEVITQEGLF